MKTSLKLLCCLCALLFNSGCVALITAGQLRNKIPKIDADKIEAEASTIWGVSGSIVEENVKWVDGRKTVGSSEERVTAPIGGYKVKVTKGRSVTEPAK